MAKKSPATSIPKAAASKWGGTNTRQIKLPSGTPLVFEDDDDCILIFLGTKDITDKVPGATDPVIYNVFFDGKRVVNCPMSYSFKELEFQKDYFYYLHLDSSILTNPNFNPMKDFNIVELGKENDDVQCDESRTGMKEMKLTIPLIAELNYTRLNYPLRRKPVKKSD